MFTEILNVSTSKKKRGPTRGHELQRMNDSNEKKKKLEIHIDPIQGRPLNKVQSVKLSSEIGIVSREFTLCLVSFPKLKQDGINVAYDQINEKCKKASESRKNMKTPHNQETKAFVVVRHELNKKLGNGQVCDRITFYKHTHFNEAIRKWTSLEAEENHTHMMELLTKSANDGNPLTPDEVCDTVMGTRSGCIKGLGYGPKPARSMTATSSLIEELREQLRQFKTENDQLKEKLDNEIKNGHGREKTLAKHEQLFRHLLGSKYDDDSATENEE